MSEVGDKVLGYLNDRCGTYRSIAWAVGEPHERVKHACQKLRKEGVVKVEYVNIRGCVKKAVVMMNDGDYTMKRDDVPAGAYAVGQTDLDGGMVVESGGEFVKKGRAPWKSTTE